MLHLLLAVLGLGLPGGLVTYLVGPAKILGFFKRAPRWAWIAFAVVAALVGGYFLHQHKAHAHDTALVKATIDKRDQLWRDALAKAHAGAIASRARTEAAGAKISTTLKGKHDAQVRSNASDARDLQLRGPGKAAVDCRLGDHPGLPAAAGQPGRPAGGANAAAAEVHPADRLAGLPAGARGDFAVIPWSWLVEQGREADDSRAEVLTWRAWYDQQAAAWERMRSQTPKPSAATKGTTNGR